MDSGLLKVNVLLIIVSGLWTLLMGILLYCFREMAAKYIRFLLPIPPIGVAAYIFVFSLFRDANGELPGNVWLALRELATATAVAALVFFIFVGASLLVVHLLKGQL
jgi:hypothetical protein